MCKCKSICNIKNKVILYTALQRESLKVIVNFTGSSLTLMEKERKKRAAEW